ncbi:MAG: glycosyl transferase family 9 [Segetibacter sp.]|nr:glycosyl transferase family 9 [Segetibacter sp.]
MNDWKHVKNILIVRADNLGDLLMSVPAIRAVKETFNANITVLTSSMAAGVAPYIPEIDEIITFDLPWIKTNNMVVSKTVFDVVETLKEKNFDAVIIFTVFSQNPLPAAMITYMAEIPLRLAYCRENPYDLLSEWVPDKEPYSFILHQVDRDLKLVGAVGAYTENMQISLTLPESVWEHCLEKLEVIGVDSSKPWIVFHAGVSEEKRKYPEEKWVATAKEMIRLGWQILFTGSSAEQHLTDDLAAAVGAKAFSLGGKLKLQEFIALIKNAPVVVSVNTATIHVAAAVQTPVVVLYAQTNPQHYPWMVPFEVLEFEVPEDMRTKNEVIQHLYSTVYTEKVPEPSPQDIINAVYKLLGKQKENPELKSGFTLHSFI